MPCSADRSCSASLAVLLCVLGPLLLAAPPAAARASADGALLHVASPADASTVAEVQEALNRLGYDAGPVDGAMGRRTRQAIQDYQRNRGMVADGAIGDRLLDSLRFDLQQVRAARPAPPRDRGARLDALRDELALIVDAAERQRAAEPWVIQRLQSLLEGAGGASAGTAPAPEPAPPPQPAPPPPEPVVPLAQADILFSDDFGDGDHRYRPRWTVVSGAFDVDRHGLRYRPPVVAEPEPAVEEEIPARIFGAILEQALGGDTRQRPAEPATDGNGEIYSSVRISNAFRLGTELALDALEGAVALGVYQGGGRDAGYFLVVTADGGGLLQLVRKTRHGSAVVDSAVVGGRLLDGRRHRIELERDDDGDMLVALDGEELLRAVDRGFRDPFDGVVLAARQVDLSLRRITVTGSR